MVVDLETRRLAQPAAASRATSVARALRAAGLRPAYFKMDSTLRGNWAVEGEAIRAALGLGLVWLAPANPVQGRSTVGGRQFVRGVPVELTPFARDPLHPVTDGSVVRMAEASLGYGRVGWLPRPQERSSRQLRWRTRDGVVVVVVDAVTGGDLQAAARVVGRRDLAMGSASWAPHVIGRGRGAGRRKGACPRSGYFCGLAVIGSLNPLTRRQVGRAARVGRVKVARVGPADLVIRNVTLLTAPPEGWLVVALDGARVRPWLGKRSPASALAAGERLAGRLGGFGAELAARLKPDALLMSGGLTAAAVLEAAGVGDLRLEAEPLPGLTVSTAVLGGRPVTVVTKPGGFGGEGALAELLAGRGGVRWRGRKP